MKGAFYASLLVLATSLDTVSPYILKLVWADGKVEEVASTSEAICDRAGQAALSGWWLPIGYNEVPVEYSCRPGSLFEPGWDQIKGRK